MTCMKLVQPEGPDFRQQQVVQAGAPPRPCTQCLVPLPTLIVNLSRLTV